MTAGWSRRGSRAPGAQVGEGRGRARAAGGRGLPLPPPLPLHGGAPPPSPGARAAPEGTVRDRGPGAWVGLSVSPQAPVLIPDVVRHGGGS